ncbi:far upstream element-binding protein 1-like isoform X2 [Telopea speciosissima]|uniref:far upstream element-binding protein 1-like isoform X2 n=1 Tax=Telopea speciosissima TaxID=54955 RepID=UPI001CC36133|nr:far upstream element-binding protein 1-like isoform X2 [Telopea speciosissima]
MAEELPFAPRMDNKRKYEDQTTPPPSSAPRRATGFSAPIASPSPDSTHSHPPSYSNVPPPPDEIQLAKQRAQEIAARLFSNAEAKRPRVENGGTDEPNDKGFGFAPTDFGQKPPSQVGFAPSSTGPVSYGFQGTSKTIDIPNGRVGVIIGKGGETIKYLQLQSGAKIQVTRDMDADPNSLTRMVELVGTAEQISKAEQLISDVLSEAETGGSGIVSRRITGQPGAEQFIMKVPNNKVGLIIGKGGETIKNMQARSGARIQLIPLHPPPGDTSTERTVHIDGTQEQIESAKQLVNEVISENRVRNPTMSGGYSQQGYRPPRPPTSWGPPGQPPMQQPGYGYMQPGAYPGPPPQYNMSQPSYAGYPPQPTSTASGWDQTSVPSSQQTTTGSGYDYYSQQPPPQQQQPQGGSSTPAESTGYGYGQPPPSGYGQPGSYGESNYTQPPAGQQGYPQDGYGGGYHAPAPQPGYGQPQPNSQPGYDHQQGYNSAPGYGNVGNPTQDGAAASYGPQGGSAQVPSSQQVQPPVQPPVTPQQGYSGQQPGTTPPSYPSQVPPAQPGYGMPPTSQPGYGSQLPAQSGFGQSAPLTQPGYGPPQAQRPPVQPLYGQSQQPPSTQGTYVQPVPAQAGYSHSQPPPTHHRPPTSSYGTAGQSGYGQQPYGGPQTAQPYGDAYGGGYTQPPGYSTTDSNVAGNGHGTYDAPPSSQAVQQGGVAKTSPQS